MFNLHTHKHSNSKRNEKKQILASMYNMEIPTHLHTDSYTGNSGAKSVTNKRHSRKNTYKNFSRPYKQTKKPRKTQKQKWKSFSTQAMTSPVGN